MINMTAEEIVEFYQDGGLSKGDALSQLADVLATGKVEDALRLLPMAWRVDVEKWIFDVYDNDIDSDDFISLGDPAPDLADRRTKIDSLRAWIKLAKTQRQVGS